MLADYDLDRARRVQALVGDTASHPAERIDASNASEVEALARAYGVDLVMNAVDPRFLMPVFRGALAADVDYMDMAVSLSEPHPTDPFHLPGVKLGDRQFELAAEWERRGRLALVGVGMDPGLCEVFAAYAQKHLFDEVHEVNVRDGGDLRIEDYGFATGVLHLDDHRGVPQPAASSGSGAAATGRLSRSRRRSASSSPRASAPWSASTSSTRRSPSCPAGCHATGHLQVRPGRRVHRGAQDPPQLGLDRNDPIRVKGVEVRPSDVVAALVPDPATLGDHMRGRAVVGYVGHRPKDGKPREVYLYQNVPTPRRRCATMASRPWLADRLQPGRRPWSCWPRGAWSGAGVLGPEAFDPDPYLAILDRDGIHHDMLEIEPGHATA